MFDYADLASTAAELVEEFGADVKLRRAENAEYDIPSATVEGGERVWNGKALRIEYEISNDDSGKRVTRARFLVSPKGMAQPTTSDRLTFGGETLVVGISAPINLAGPAVAYDVRAIS